MRRALPLLLCIPLSLSLLHAQGNGKPEPAKKLGSAPTAQRQYGYPEVFTDLKDLATDPAASAQVKELTLTRDAMTFTLGSGTIRFCKPVAGRVCGAVFVGKGSYAFTPSTQVEREQLARFYKKEAMAGEMTSLFMLFADTTAEELRRKLAFAAGGAGSDFDDVAESAMDFVVDTKYGSFDDEFARAFLNRDHNDLFYAQIGASEGGPFFFEIDPYEFEEVRFMREGSVAVSTFRELINQFPIASAAANDQVRDQVKIERYVVDGTIADNLDVAFTTEMTYTPIGDDPAWVALYLHPELRVDSVSWADGRPAIFHQTGGESLWLNDEPTTGESRTVRVHYHGKVFLRERDWILLTSSVGWYPYHGYLSHPLFDMTFHTPSHMKFASVGRNVSTTTNGDMVTSHWVLDRPTRNASFNIGIFSQQDFTPDSMAPVTVLRGEGSSAGMGEQVGWDVEHSIKFYEFLFGKLQLDHFYATEIPAVHGEAFPGLIHLSSITFGDNDGAGNQEIFRAHEVAHQWWGIGVGFKTYHDQWLSEAFAEYSGLMYMQAVLKNNEKFFKRLAEYKRSVIDNRKSLFVESSQAGPIWLGQRTSGTSTAGDYDLIVYKKGAWVLHMLRNMMLDLNTMKEEKFRGTMREFYAIYVGKAPSTEDFQHVVEKNMGMDMGWFFKEWIYGTGAPSYRYAWHGEELPGGKYKVSLRVDQANVPETFQMYVPVKVDFGGGKMARLRVLVRGPHSEQDLPLLPLEPKKIVFNDLESVLCDVEEVEW